MATKKVKRRFLGSLEMTSWDSMSKARSEKITQSKDERLLRKEVIQPHVPVRLPCYDFTPLTKAAFGPYGTSSHSRSAGVTGGVYKARVRIHRGVADPRLLAIPAS